MLPRARIHQTVAIDQSSVFLYALSKIKKRQRTAALRGVGDKAKLLECASPLALFHSLLLPFFRGLEFIKHLQSINLKAVNRFYNRLGSRAFEPCCRTPRILVSDRDKSVPDGVLVDVIEPRKIGSLIGETRFAKVIPNLARWCAIQLIQPP